MSFIGASFWCSNPLRFSRISPTGNLSLNLVANRPSFQEETLFFRRIREAVQGRVSYDDQRDFHTILSMASRLKGMLKGTPLFINTKYAYEMVDAVQAEGIYLEEHTSISRKVHLGAFTNTLQETTDYLIINIWPLLHTSTRNDHLWGIRGLKKVKATVIGSVSLMNVHCIYPELRLRDGAVMASGLMQEKYPHITAQKIQSLRQRTQSAL